MVLGPYHILYLLQITISAALGHVLYLLQITSSTALRHVPYQLQIATSALGHVLYLLQITTCTPQLTSIDLEPIAWTLQVLLKQQCPYVTAPKSSLKKHFK